MKNGITVVSAAAIDFLWGIGYNNPVWAYTKRLRQYRIFGKRTDEMYYYVKGELALLESDRAVIDCGGVGYLLSITKNTYDDSVVQNNTSNLANVNSLSTSNVTTGSTITLLLPKEIARNYPKKWIPQGTRFLVSFIGGDLTKPVIIGREFDGQGLQQS